MAVSSGILTKLSLATPNLSLTYLEGSKNGATAVLQIERLMESLISPSDHSICEIFHRVLAATVPPLYIMVCAVLLRALDVSKGKNMKHL